MRSSYADNKWSKQIIKILRISSINTVKDHQERFVELKLSTTSKSTLYLPAHWGVGSMSLKCAGAKAVVKCYQSMAQTHKYSLRYNLKVYDSVFP